MDPLHDPAIALLPHPIRADAAMGCAYDSLLFQKLGITAELKPYLNDDTAATEWLINHLPLLNRVAEAHLEMPGTVNLGTFILMMTRARLRAHGDPILTVTPHLQDLLTATDVIQGLPARYFRCPFALAYVAFSSANGLVIPNRVTGLHEFEGAYVGTYTLKPHHDMFANVKRAQGLHLDPAKPTRLIELTLIGSPVGKDNTLDDASQDLTIGIQDEDECLTSLLERHLAYYQRPDAYSSPHMQPATSEEVQRIRPLVLALAKVLLYLNLGETEQVKVNAREELALKYRKYGKLTAPRQAQLARVYNHILLGPSHHHPDHHPPTPGGEAGYRVRPHWKRGHFKRIHFGEKLHDTRLGWIQPYLVNKAEAFGTVKAKEYVVR